MDLCRSAGLGRRGLMCHRCRAPTRLRRKITPCRLAVLGKSGSRAGPADPDSAALRQHRRSLVLVARRRRSGRGVFPENGLLLAGARGAFRRARISGGASTNRQMSGGELTFKNTRAPEGAWVGCWRTWSVASRLHCCERGEKF